MTVARSDPKRLFALLCLDVRVANDAAVLVKLFLNQRPEIRPAGHVRKQTLHHEHELKGRNIELFVAARLESLNSEDFDADILYDDPLIVAAFSRHPARSGSISPSGCDHDYLDRLAQSFAAQMQVDIETARTRRCDRDQCGPIRARPMTIPAE
jgi:hypothetical protein